jgi:hypothetical protein
MLGGAGGNAEALGNVLQRVQIVIHHGLPGERDPTAVLLDAVGVRRRVVDLVFRIGRLRRDPE